MLSLHIVIQTTDMGMINWICFPAVELTMMKIVQTEPLPLNHSSKWTKDEIAL